MSLPTTTNAVALGQQLAQRAQAMGAGTSEFPFLKMDKAGDWVYGADDIEVQEGSTWAVNPHSFVEGYICWGEGEVLGEEMAPMTGQPVIAADLPKLDGAKKGWEKQVGFMLVCLNGEDKGEQVLYKSSSKGGQKGSRKLIDSVVKQIAVDPSSIVPHVQLNSDSYKHPTYGKINNPIFEIVGWSGVEATPEVPTAEAEAPELGDQLQASQPPHVEPEPEPAPKKKPAVAKKRKRRAIAG